MRRRVLSVNGQHKAVMYFFIVAIWHTLFLREPNGKSHNSTQKDEHYKRFHIHIAKIIGNKMLLNNLIPSGQFPAAWGVCLQRFLIRRRIAAGYLIALPRGALGPPIKNPVARLQGKHQGVE
jgi:hypothetical protein